MLVHVMSRICFEAGKLIKIKLDIGKKCNMPTWRTPLNMADQLN